VLVRSTDAQKLTTVLENLNGVVEGANDHALSVSGLTSDQIGHAAFDAGVTILELTPQRASLEEVFMDLTADAVEYGGSTLESTHDE
jgi:ABC-2 type transport system ATP-binding protein